MQYEKLFEMSIFFGFCFFLNLNNVLGYSFSISANRSWARDLSLQSYMKTTATSVSTVIWERSNYSNHYMWFGVNDQSDNTKGTGKYSYLSEGSFTTNIQATMNNSSYSYYLIARREYALDPVTTVSGQWLP